MQTYFLLRFSLMDSWKLVFKLTFRLFKKNKLYENSMGDFWAESIRLASPVTERFLCVLGQGKSRLIRYTKTTYLVRNVIDSSAELDSW